MPQRIPEHLNERVSRLHIFPYNINIYICAPAGYKQQEVTQCSPYGQTYSYRHNKCLLNKNNTQFNYFPKRLYCSTLHFNQACRHREILRNIIIIIIIIIIIKKMLAMQSCERVEMCI